MIHHFSTLFVTFLHISKFYFALLYTRITKNLESDIVALGFHASSQAQTRPSFSAQEKTDRIRPARSLDPTRCKKKKVDTPFFFLTRSRRLRPGDKIYLTEGLRESVDHSKANLFIRPLSQHLFPSLNPHRLRRRRRRRHNG